MAHCCRLLLLCPGKDGAFKLSLCPFTFGSHFSLLVSAFLLQTPSPFHIFLLKQKKKTQKKKNHREGKKMEKRDGV
jgi:hypothetical protein